MFTNKCKNIFIIVKKKKAKLTIELVPSTCWYSNVRSTLPKKEWDRLRKESYEKAGYKCEICGSNGLEQGYKHKLECHEIWKYDDKKKIQRLEGLISLCPRCHQTKHFGRSTAIGMQGVIIEHLEKVNGWDHKETVEYIAQCYKKHSERSKHQWKLDINMLHSKHKVDKKLITEAHKKRKNKKKIVRGKPMKSKKKYKKKRKRKSSRRRVRRRKS